MRRPRIVGNGGRLYCKPWSTPDTVIIKACGAYSYQYVITYTPMTSMLISTVDISLSSFRTHTLGVSAVTCHGLGDRGSFLFTTVTWQALKPRTGEKRLGREASEAEVNNAFSYLFAPPYWFLDYYIYFLAVPCLRLLVPSPWRLLFAPGSVHVGIPTNKEALGQVYLSFIQFSPVCIISPWLFILIQLSLGGWIIGSLVAVVQRQSHPIDMKNNSYCFIFSSSFTFPFVPLQRRGCLVAPLFLWIVLVPCAGD
jgi:hypothetical protein